MATYTSVWGCNLGDTLWVTPLARHFDDLVIKMLRNDLRSRLTAPILEGIGKIEFVSQMEETRKDNTLQDHVTQRILRAYGKSGFSIPFVKLRQSEIEWARQYLVNNGINISQCLAIINHNSGSGDPTNIRSQYVRPPREIIFRLASIWSKQYQIVQFGPAPTYHDTDPFDPISGAVIIRGLTIRQLAACYYLIGKMISGDTGDYHLMLAVGGKTATLVPPHSEHFGYKHWDLLYDQKCWANQKSRSFYALHQMWEWFTDLNLFL